MGENSKIGWTHHTFNPWIGCAKVAPGCTHCYAEAFANRYGKAEWGANGTRVKTSEANWRKPLKWNREAEKAGERRRVFCASLADVFEDWQGPILHHTGVQLWHSGMPQYEAADASYYSPVTMGDLRRDLFALIDATPWLDWLLLTKRPENVRRMWPWGGGDATDYDQQADKSTWKIRRNNVWLGTSISDQSTFDRYAHNLYHGCRDLAPVLFISGEPLLGAVKMHHDFDGDKVRNWFGENGFDWVIVGCESRGPRVGRLGGSEAEWQTWAASIVSDCKANGVAAFVKQVPVDGFVRHEVADFPAELQTQEFPAVLAV